MPLSRFVMEFMQAFRVDGRGQNDHGSIVQFYEKLARSFKSFQVKMV